MFRKQRGLQRSKLELEQPMPQWMSGCRFVYSLSLSGNVILYLSLDFGLYWGFALLLTCIDMSGYCIYSISIQQIKEEEVDEHAQTADSKQD